MSTAHTIPPSMGGRILSMDQFRGFAIFGMLLVDYFEVFRHSWYQLHHHRDFMTYADTIAPIFLFVVGMGMRLSMQRRIEKVGLTAARHGLLNRYLLLVLIAFTLYTGYLWDALMNIGLAGIIALWLVDKRPTIRIGAALGFLAVYQAIFSWTVYGDWLLRTIRFEGDTMPFIFKLIPFGPELVKVPINGGPIGHWSWLLMLICGTIAYDIMATKNTRKIVTACLLWGIGLCLAGWLLRAEWAGIKEFWPLSKYYMTAPFAFFATGICFLHLLVFHVINDVMKWELPHLTVFGLNPLFIYILQWCIMASGRRFLPRDTENMIVLLGGFVVFYAVCYGIAYYLYRKQIFIKL
jgi:predicted acyltransferase